MKKSIRFVTLWIATVCVWCAVAALCFIMPSYEGGNGASAALEVAIEVSRILRWHWIPVSIVLVAGTLSLLAYTVRTAYRARAAAKRRVTL